MGLLYSPIDKGTDFYMIQIFQLFILVILPAILFKIFHPLIHKFDESLEILGTRESIRLLNDIIEHDGDVEDGCAADEEGEDENIPQLSRWLLTEGQRNLLELVNEHHLDLNIEQ